MILRNLIGKEECSENDHFLNTQILKKIAHFVSKYLTLVQTHVYLFSKAQNVGFYF